MKESSGGRGRSAEIAKPWMVRCSRGPVMINLKRGGGEAGSVLEKAVLEDEARQRGEVGERKGSP